MQLAVQAVIVAILVFASAVFAAWRLMPARTRLRVLDAMKPTGAHAAGRWLLRLRQSALTELTHGCGSCSQASNHTDVGQSGVATRQGRRQKPRLLPP